MKGRHSNYAAAINGNEVHAPEDKTELTTD